MDLRNLLPQDINRYQEYLVNDLKLKPRSIKRKISSLKRFLKWAKDKNYTDFIISDFNNNKTDKKLDISSIKDSPPEVSIINTNRLNELGDDYAVLLATNTKSKFFDNTFKNKPYKKKHDIFNFLNKIVPLNRLYPEKKGLDYKDNLDGVQNALPFWKRLINKVNISNSKVYKTYHSSPITHYLHFSLLIIFTILISFGLYEQLFKKTPTPLANPPGTKNVVPSRYLSFQGRLTDSSDNPITVTTNVKFAIYNDPVAFGTSKLWEEKRVADPDNEGIFNIILGQSIPIPATLFSENGDLWLGITVGKDKEAFPRQRIATVGFAQNAEFLQGHPPSASASANQIPVLTESGDLYIAQKNARIYSSSGGFRITAQTLTLESENGGDITVRPDQGGRILLRSENLDLNTFEVNNSQIISGNLITGYAGNNNTGYNLLKLTSGSTQTQKFVVDYAGNASSSGDLIVGAIDTTPNISTTNLRTLTLGNSSTGAIVLAPGGTTALTAYSNDITISDTLTIGNTLSVQGNTIGLNNDADSDNVLSFNSASSGAASGNLYWGNTLLCTASDSNCGWTPSSGTSNWQRNSGVLSSKNITDDLLIGGPTATASSSTSDYFQIFGTGSNAGNASSSGILTLGTNRTSGIIETEKMLPLVIGSSTTGSIQLSPKGTTGLFVNGAGNVGIGTTSPTQILTIQANINGLTETLITNSNAGSSAYAQYEVGNDAGAFGSFGIGSSTTTANVYGNRVYFAADSNTNGITILTAGSSDDIRFFTAGETTSNERLRIDGSGNIGIGLSTIAPNFRLDLSDSQASTVSAMVTNTNTGTDADGLAVKLGYTGSGNANNSFITFLNGAGSIQGKIHSNGADGVTYKTSGIDYAEYFTKKDGEYFEEGDLVSLDQSTNKATKSKTDYDAKLIGIVSSHPGFAGGHEGDNKVLVGIVGQVPVKISSQSESISSGDPLTSSTDIGRTIKATKAGPIVGKAMEDWTPESGKTTIQAFINLSWYDPNIKINNEGNLVNTNKDDLPEFVLDLETEEKIRRSISYYKIIDSTGSVINNSLTAAKAVFASLKAGFIETEALVVNNILFAKKAVINNLNSIEITADNIKSQLLSVNKIEVQEDLFSPIVKTQELTSNNIKTDIISPIADDVDIENAKLKITDDSKEFKIVDQQENNLLTINSQGDASISGNITGQDGQFNNILMEQFNNTGDASISGTLYANKVVSDEVITNKITVIEKIQEIIQRIVKEDQTQELYADTATPASASASLSYNDLMKIIDEAKGSANSITNDLDANSLTLSSNLYVYGQSNLNDAFITGNLTQGVSFQITGGDTISTLLTDMNIKSIGGKINFADGSLIIDEKGDAYFSKDLTIIGKLNTAQINSQGNDLTIDLGLESTNSAQFASKFGKLLVKGNVYTEGNIQARNASFSGTLVAESLKLSADYTATNSGLIIASANTASSSGIFAPSIKTNGTTGLGLIPAGEKEVVVYNDKVSNNKLIYLTPTSNTDNKVIYVKSKSEPQTIEDPLTGQIIHNEGFFIVAIDSPVTNDISFNWWIIN